MSITTSPSIQPAFLLTRQWQDIALPDSPREKKLQLVYWFVGQSGPMRVVINDQESLFFIEEKDEPEVSVCLNRLFLSATSVWYIKKLALSSFTQQPIMGVYFYRQRDLYLARDKLKDQAIGIYEADIQPQDRFLMERFISGGVNIEGKSIPRDGFVEYINPTLQVSNFTPSLKVVSLDIETSMTGDTLYSIGVTLHHYHPDSEENKKALCEPAQKVFMLRHKNSKVSSLEYVEYCDDEKAVLTGFLQWYHSVDPDCIIGWSVINFDLKFLQEKADALRIPLTLGRAYAKIDWRTSRINEDYLMVVVPGRVVLDGIDTLRSATYSFESFSLDFVAKTLLQRGKLIHDVHNRGTEITQLFYKDQDALARYNLQDCKLVWDIFEHTHLMRFALERARMTGLPMDRHGGSVAAFDFHYLPRLHRKGYVAPSLQEDPQGIGSPGGYVLDSKPGLYSNVLVLDFKSLYPSIIRTFNIDPLAMIEGQTLCPSDTITSLKETPDVDRTLCVPGFNGATFAKCKTILPTIIGELWKARDKAKQEKNSSMSQAIKILMNSFYGVLGTPGCRFFDYRLPSSITLRGHAILKQTRTLIEQQGFEVIYGDTDSVFVWLRDAKENPSSETLLQMGTELANTLNLWWRDYLHQKYDIPCFLEVEFETCFARFVMPTIRNSELGSKKRYAGLTIQKNADNPAELVFKGLEAVRTDWTHMAREFQRELYRRVFMDEPIDEFVRSSVEDIFAGRCDSKLVYRKRLRRKLSEYRKNIPPHVQAAKLAEQLYLKQGLKSPYSRGSWVEYVMTVNGPQPIDMVQAPLDYDLYVERQIIPIVDSIAQFLSTTYEDIAGKQMGLF